MADDLGRATRILNQGGIVAYATEYCFGLGCDPHNCNAVYRLLRIKRRPISKGLIVIGADIGQFTPYVERFPREVLATWPGPHTWLLTPCPGVPRWITGHHARIAVRVTAHPQAAALCRTVGMAIVSTSANRTRESPVRNCREVLRRFGNDVDYVLRGRVGDAPAPTPIRDAITGDLVRCG